MRAQQSIIDTILAVRAFSYTDTGIQIETIKSTSFPTKMSFVKKKYILEEKNN